MSCRFRTSFGRLYATRPRLRHTILRGKLEGLFSLGESGKNPGHNNSGPQSWPKILDRQSPGPLKTEASGPPPCEQGRHFLLLSWLIYGRCCRPRLLQCKRSVQNWRDYVSRRAATRRFVGTGGILTAAGGRRKLAAIRRPRRWTPSGRNVPWRLREGPRLGGREWHKRRAIRGLTKAMN